MFSPIVVCHQLRSKDNLGAIARVMANFGFDDLVLSDPVTHDFRGVERMGVKADTVLDRFAIASSLAEALGKAVYAVGTTSRTQLKRGSVLTPEEGVARLAAQSARGRVALVLGGEKRGLSDEELAWCQDVIAIPTPGPQPSMNLAQAATVLLYLCSRAQVPQSVPAPPKGAPLELVHRLEAKLQETLTTAQFLNPQAPQHLLHELSRALVHGALSRREVEVWIAAVDHLKRHLKP